MKKNKSFSAPAVLVPLIASLAYSGELTANSNYDALESALADSCFPSFIDSNFFSQSDFLSDCSNALSAGEDAFSALTPDEIFSVNTNITSAAINDTFDRMATLRTIGGGAGDDSIVSRFDVYVNGHASWQEYNQDQLNPGFDIDDNKVTIGADYRFTDNFIAGLSASYLSSDTQFKQGAGDIDTDGYSFAVYSSYSLDDRFFIDGTFSYSDQRHRTSRNIVYTGVNQTARADVDSDTFAAGLVTGYNFFVDDWTFTPTARWMYRSLQLGGYSESMSNPSSPGGSLAVSIGDQNYESITGNFGAQLTYAWSQSWGVLIPTLAAEYVHEFADTSQGVSVGFTNAPGSSGSFVMRNSERDKDYAVINAGVSAQFMQGISAFVTYEKLLDLNAVTSDSLSMGLRMELN